MTKQFKVGDKVRILGKEGIDGGHDLTNGNTYEVNDVDDDGWIRLNDDLDDGVWISTDEFNNIEKVSDKPTKNQRIMALESEVATLTRRIEALEQGKSCTHTPRISVEVAKPLTPNQQASANSLRKVIIDEAKAFIEDVLTEVDQQMGWKTTAIPLYKAKGRLHVNFHINDKKRTVVALAYYGNLYPQDKEVIGKAIAKCAPDDVFNADIGKAIALGRALGLDVSKFEQAVKPTEAVAGMMAECVDNFGDNYVEKVLSGRALFIHCEDRLRKSPEKLVAILDDTEAQY